MPAHGQVISAEGLSKRYGETVALDDVTFGLDAPAIGLLGANGAGKSTLMKALLGLVRPDGGRLSVIGRDVTDGPGELRRRLGYMPEGDALPLDMAARDLIVQMAELRGLRRRAAVLRASEVLFQVGLEEERSRLIRTFSTGMRQRTKLAQAIVHSPDLVILDEPMSGLDPLGRREVRDLVLGLRDAGKTVFFSSHILQDAEMICDRVAILVSGRLRHLGSVHDLVSSKPRWFEVAIDGEVPPRWAAETVSNLGAHALVRVPDVEMLTRLVAEVADGGGQVVSVWPRRDTLEDLFLREVGEPEGRT